MNQAQENTYIELDLGKKEEFEVWIIPNDSTNYSPKKLTSSDSLESAREYVKEDGPYYNGTLEIIRVETKRVRVV